MKKVVMALFLISLFLLPEQNFALSCVEPSPPDVAYDEYDAVIIGTVEEIKEYHDTKVLEIRVDTSYKGIDTKVIAVEEDITWGESQLNASYLYYLNEEGEKWLHPLCSPTTSNTDIAEEFLADREEIALQNVVSEPEDKIYIVFLEIILAVLTAVRLMMKSRKVK